MQTSKRVRSFARPRRSPPINCGGYSRRMTLSSTGYVARHVSGAFGARRCPRASVPGSWPIRQAPAPAMSAMNTDARRPRAAPVRCVGAEDEPPPLAAPARRCFASRRSSQRQQSHEQTSHHEYSRQQWRHSAHKLARPVGVSSRGRVHLQVARSGPHRQVRRRRASRIVSGAASTGRPGRTAVTHAPDRLRSSRRHNQHIALSRRHGASPPPRSGPRRTPSPQPCTAGRRGQSPAAPPGRHPSSCFCASECGRPRAPRPAEW
eukprot:986867-Prymnesium_polylepis.1